MPLLFGKTMFSGVFNFFLFFLADLINMKFVFIGLIESSLKSPQLFIFFFFFQFLIPDSYGSFKFIRIWR